jgi:hypothetical protein
MNLVLKILPFFHVQSKSKVEAQCYLKVPLGVSRFDVVRRTFNRIKKNLNVD